MTAADLAATHAAAFADRRAWSAQEFQRFLDSPHVILCGDAKSFLLGRVIADEAEVLTLATDPKFRRKGLAQICLVNFLDRATDHGAAFVFLEVAADNAPAKALYLKNNFIVTGERPGYYTSTTGEKVSAVLMRRPAI